MRRIKWLPMNLYYLCIDHDVSVCIFDATAAPASVASVEHNVFSQGNQNFFSPTWQLTRAVLYCLHLLKLLKNLYLGSKQDFTS